MFCCDKKYNYWRLTYLHNYNFILICQIAVSEYPEKTTDLSQITDKSLSVTFDRSVVFSGYSGFLHK